MDGIKSEQVDASSSVCPDGIIGICNGDVQWFNLTRAAAHLQVSAKTLRLAAERGDISGIHPLPDGPWLFDRAVLEMPETKAILQHARQHAKPPAGPALEQQSLFTSMT